LSACVGHGSASVWAWRIISKDSISDRHFGQLIIPAALACLPYARHAPAACLVREDESGRNGAG